jgi:nuclear transport factor 2 (NTF2) superfamily protein
VVQAYTPRTRNWEFDEATGLMRRRDASVNDYRISRSERRIALD